MEKLNPVRNTGDLTVEASGEVGDLRRALPAALHRFLEGLGENGFASLDCCLRQPL
jgi:hypothetical protein